MRTQFKNLQSACPERGTIVAHHDSSGCSTAIPNRDRSSISSKDTLTKREAAEVERRRELLDRFTILRARGFTAAQAAKKVRASQQSLWRWKRIRIEPITHRCGRKSMFNALGITSAVIEKVQRLQLAGRGNAAAWKAFALDPDCPAKLKTFLKGKRNVARSLLKASALRSQRVTLLQGAGFTVINNTQSNRTNE
jgi:hypothetical protein